MKTQYLPNLKCLSFCSALIVLFALLRSNQAESAKKEYKTLSPGKVIQLKEINKGYRVCTLNAVRSVKTRQTSLSELSGALASCKDQYPVVDLYTKCKQEVLKKKATEARDFSECNYLLKHATFDPLDPVPLFLKDGQAYTSGVGLNVEIKTDNLDIPDFSCKEFNRYKNNIADARYLLFGNLPGLFGTDRTQKEILLATISERIKGARKGQKAPADFVDIDGFGRLFPEVKGKIASQVAYFPSAPCHYSGPLGSIYSGISVFYLIHPKSSGATPYFSASYYRKSQTAIDTKTLAKETKEILGPGYKVFPKDSRTLFVAESSFSDTDKEGDPRNLCKLPRLHQFVAVIRGFEDSRSRPEYLILANVKNLCDYGDRLVSLIGR
jgi:hypothetical protein